MSFHQGIPMNQLPHLRRILRMFGSFPWCEDTPGATFPAGSLRDILARELKSDMYRDMAGLPRLRTGSLGVTHDTTR